LSTAKYRTRYEKLLGELPEANDIGEVSIICPFHEDHKRSASVNLKTGLFFCLACEASHNYPTFRKAHIEEHGQPDETVPPDPDDKVVPDQTIRDMHFSLLENQPLIDRLRDERGVSIETIREYQIGFHQRTRRIAIPIRDHEGIARNVRLYSFSEKGQQKMLSWQQGYGTARLWPMESLTNDVDYVFLCEGEMDRMVLHSRGLNSVTSTGGAKTWKSEWSKSFKGKKVYVVYDMDQAGDEGARKAAASIAEFAKLVKVVRLDLTTAGEDITDYFVNYGYGVPDLRKLVKKTPQFKKPIATRPTASSNGKVEWTTLGSSLKPDYRKRELMIPVIVSARRDERLHYPVDTMFTCDQSAGNICQKCNLYGSGEANVTINKSDPAIIDFVGVTTKQQYSIIRQRAGIPASCLVVESATLDSGTIEEILVTPELDTSRDDTLHLVQRAFYIGLGLDYNESYVMRAKPVPFHKNGKIVHHVVEATPAHDSIESFEMTPEIHEQLQVFQAKPGGAKKKLWDIATDFQNHVTKIWDRIPIHIAMDLVWHSVLEFWFEDKLQRRGWLETCVVGDTRTGKSEIASQLQRHFGYGEIVSGENTSYAGLIGGAVKFDDAWFVKWGRIPLNDRRLVIIDEVTGMRPEDIALMSGVRESGIADITKIETQKANARTRAIWIGNVREPKNDLSDYDYGCLALHDLIGQPEDIARFDYCIAAARNEVSSTTVNSRHDITGQGKYSSEACANLILWAWSRGRDTVIFERGAVDAAHRHAIEMGKTYTSNVPLVMAENQRIKLARIAAAIAARLFSTDDGENLIVTEEHVNAARDLLDMFYSTPSFGYEQLSRQKLGFARRRQAGIEQVTDLLKTRPQLADMLSRTKLINPTKIADYTGITDEEAKEVLRKLTSTMMVEDKGSHGYGVTNDLKTLAEQNIPLEYELSGANE
jgi:hypothetical protein